LDRTQIESHLDSLSVGASAIYCGGQIFVFEPRQSRSASNHINGFDIQSSNHLDIQHGTNRTLVLDPNHLCTGFNESCVFAPDHRYTTGNESNSRSGSESCVSVQDHRYTPQNESNRIRIAPFLSVSPSTYPSEYLSANLSVGLSYWIAIASRFKLNSPLTSSHLSVSLLVYWLFRLKQQIKF